MSFGNQSPGSTEMSIESTLLSLESEKIKLQSEDKFIEANALSLQIKDLKSRLHKEKLTNLISTHSTEKEMVQQSFEQELILFDSNWNQVISKFLRKCDKELNKLMKSHVKNEKKHRHQLENQIMVNFKPSPCLLNMMKCKEQAVKLEKLVEAQALWVQIEQLRADEEEKYKELKKYTIDQHIANFNADYERKMQAMKKKHKSRLEELNIQRENALEMLVRKYDNLKRGLENSQQIRVNIHEGKHTTCAGRHGNSPEKVKESTLSIYRQKSLITKQES